MKRVLPKTHLNNTSSGFTLIELMVVIAIIAILAVIGATVFAGAQAQARDGERRSEITSLAKSIEASKDFNTGNYVYNTTQANSDFPQGIPTDPSSPRPYCVDGLATTTPPTNPATWTTTCPTGYTELVASMNATTGVELGSNNGMKSFTLCAALERSTTPYCVTSLTR